MKFIEDKIYNITFPNGDKCTAGFVKETSYPASGMPSDYTFSGISGKWPRHEQMHPQFPLPEFLIDMTKFQETDVSQMEAQDKQCKALLEEYRNTPLNSSKATELEKQFWALKSENTKELIKEALTNRLAQLQAMQDIL